MFKKLSFYERMKEIVSNTQTLHERIEVHIKKKGIVHVMNF